MPASMAAQPTLSGSSVQFRTLKFSLQSSLPPKPHEPQTISVKPKASHCSFSCRKAAIKAWLSASSTSEPILAEEDVPNNKEKLRVVVKPMEKPRVVLKFIWMEKAIGMALDQVIPGHGAIPLSPYHFWPRNDAWEQLKSLLESKPWISQKQMIILLNHATDIINLWQETTSSP
uniref:Uncharacterized protein MANES_01G109300 n=1 Tax=Rhizophora mucronata TaxID=61149 RepID=A0A2P2QML5_RHIMU